MKKVILLGATGSIGKQTIDIIRNNPDQFELCKVSFNTNIEEIIRIIDEFKPLEVATNDDKSYHALQEFTYDNTTIFNQIDVLLKPMKDTIVINAITGYVGFIYSYQALQNGFDLYLANKESLVVAGQILKKIAQEKGLKIIPIDSEHTSLLDLKTNNNQEKIVKHFITASGGPFYKMSKEQLENVTLKDALKHPNWQMGKHITINSATMVNKLYEIVEASYLFDLTEDDLFVLVDPKSKIHSGIILDSMQVIGHLSNTDMHLPIEYALKYPNGLSYNQDNNIYDYDAFVKRYELGLLSDLDYPILKLRSDILTKNSFSGIIITTVNDLLVESFLNGEIKFIDISYQLMKIHNKLIKEFQDLEFNIENIEYVKCYIERGIKNLWSY